MEYEQRKRIEALTHLRAAIMHIEAAMVLDSVKWTGDEVKLARDARDRVRQLGESLDT